jgi:hypothetical protein
LERLIFFFEESISYEFKIYKEDEKENEFCILDTKGELEELFLKALLKFVVILLKKSLY